MFLQIDARMEAAMRASETSCCIDRLRSLVVFPPEPMSTKDGVHQMFVESASPTPNASESLP